MAGTICPKIPIKLYSILLEKSLKVLNIPPNYSLIGGGQCGNAYLVGNQIYKITTDKSEAIESNKLIGKNNDRIANVFNVKKINNTLTNIPVYLVVLERLNTDRSAIFYEIEESLMDLFKESMGEHLFDVLYYYRFDQSRYESQYENDVKDILEPHQKEWFFYKALLQIIDELKENNIDSLDVQYHNLGMKPNGNLAFFDLGYGDENGTVDSLDINEDIENLYDRLDKENIDEVSFGKKIAAKLGYDPYGIHLLGNGTQGIAFDVGQNTVMKITTDKSEVTDASKLIGKNNKNLGNFFKVFRLSKPFDFVFVILREKLYVDVSRNVKAIEAFDRYRRSLGIAESDIIRAMRENDKNIINRFTFDLNKIEDEQSKKYISDILSIINELIENKIPSYDFTPSNFGFKQNGDLAYYDIGYSKNDESDSVETLTLERNTIVERVMSYMKGSSAMNVKKKCQIGGNGDGTSTACNQGDISNIELSKISEGQDKKIEYGALMLKIPIKNWSKITDEIDKNDIYDKSTFGIEDEPHITILYGFHKEVTSKEIENLLKEKYKHADDIEVELIGISHFETPNYDVVKFDVKSKELVELNKLMKKLPYTSDFPDYHPHMTISYVKKGTGKKYNKKIKTPIKFKGSDIVYSTVKGKITTLSEHTSRWNKIKEKKSNIQKLVEIELDNVSEGINVYHGTMNKFDNFSGEKVGSENNREMGGWGIYLTTDPNVARQYGHNILNAEIPNGTYLDLDDGIDDHLAQFIVNYGSKFGLPYSAVEQFKTDFISDDYRYSTTNHQVLEWLKDVLADSQKAMNFLDRAGFIGTKFSDKTNRDATNYVIFDPKNIKIKHDDSEQIDEQDSSFDRKTFENIKSFASRKQYADQHYQKLGTGSSRIVYKLPSGNVLKLAKNAKGLAQNENECSLGQDQYFGDLLAKVVDCDQNDLWVVSEEAKQTTPQRFEQITGANFEEVGKLIINVYANNNPARMQQEVPQDQTIVEELYENEFVSQLLEMMNSYDLVGGDLTRIDSYGEVLRNGQPDIVLRDYGINGATWYQHYDKSKNKRFNEEYFGMNEQKDIEINDLPFKSDVEAAGGKIYSVGGAVRDKILGRESKDLDLLITGIPLDQLEAILHKYGKVDNVGKSFGIIKFNTPETGELDIAIPRTERKNDTGGYQGFDVTSDHTLPIEKDLERRDFTINAIAKDSSGLMIDPYGGQGDIEKKQIKMVNPQAFSDDPLRMIRAVQFAARFGFEIEPTTMAAIQQNAAKIKEISPERILIEFDKIVKKGQPIVAAKLLQQSGLYQQIFGVGKDLNLEDFKHVKTMGDFIFALLHRGMQQPAEYFKNYMKGDLDTYNEIKALQMGAQYKGRKTIFDMYKTSPKSLDTNMLGQPFKDNVAYMKAHNIPFSLKEVPVNGTDLMNMGYQGKQIGDMLIAVLNKIYKEELPNEREAILQFVQSLAQQQAQPQ